MQQEALNELMAERHQKCEKRHIYIDIQQGKAKCYAKAKHFQAHTDRLLELQNPRTITSLPQGDNVPFEVTNPNFSGKLITPNLSTNQKAEGLICKNNSIDTPSGIFQYLGVDYVEARIRNQKAHSLPE